MYYQLSSLHLYIADCKVMFVRFGKNRCCDNHIDHAHAVNVMSASFLNLHDRQFKNLQNFCTCTSATLNSSILFIFTGVQQNYSIL